LHYAHCDLQPLRQFFVWIFLGVLSVYAVSGRAVAQEQEPEGEQTQVQTEKAPEVARFDIYEYQVSGNTLLDVKDVERTLYPHLGAGKAFEDIETARKALQQRYRDAGYPAVLVEIPEQRVSEGVVWLRVLESRISNLRISGSRYYSPDLLAREMPSLEKGKRLRVDDLQEEITAAGMKYPERILIPVLKPGKTPGSVEAELKVRDKLPLHGGIEINDRFSENTSRWRSSLSIGYSNLWQRGHAFNLQYQTAPEEPDESKVWSGTYTFRPGFRNAIVAIYAIDSKSNTAALGDVNVVGNGNIYGLRWIEPWSVNKALSNSLSVGLEYKDFEEDLVLLGADRIATPIDYLTMTVGFSSTLRHEERSTGFDISATFGIRGVGSSAEEFDTKRFGAKANFFYIQAGVRHTQPLFFGDALLISLKGQIANSPLVSNEQYSAGGSETVRGYHESQVLGDDGLIGTLEWHSPSLLGAWDAPERSLYGLIFIDGAEVHLQDALPDQESRQWLTSAGVGLRFRQGTRWDLRLDGAQVFKDAGSVESGDTRWHVYFNYAF
jgi:hemolysin activation/secretion protein